MEGFEHFPFASLNSKGYGAYITPKGKPVCIWPLLISFIRSYSPDR